MRADFGRGYLEMISLASFRFSFVNLILHPGCIGSFRSSNAESANLSLRNEPIHPLLRSFSTRSFHMSTKSSVDLAHDRVDGADYRDAVGDEPVLHQMGHRLEVDEARAPHMHAVGGGGSVADHVDAEFTTG